MGLKSGIFVIFLSLFIIFFAYPVGYYVLPKSNQIKTVETQGEYKGIVAYLINLDRSKERFDYVKPNLDKLGYDLERISAVDGSTLTEQELNEKVDFEAYVRFLNHYPRKGTIGCSLSHIAAWQKFLASSYEYAVIFEDDVTFDPEKLRNVIEQLIERPNNWDINTFELSHMGWPITVKQLSGTNTQVVYLFEVAHTGSYIINRKAAKKLLEKALPIKMPVDHYFTRTWELGYNFTGIENPRLVHQRFGNSDIGVSKCSREAQLNLSTKLNKGLYKLQSSTMRILYGLKSYVELKFLS